MFDFEPTEPLLHWNYFISLENDLETISRYIEFSEPNFKTFSIELTRCYLSAASEIDVVFKELCTLLDSSKKYDSINKYYSCIGNKCPDFINLRVHLKRYAIHMLPWEKWEYKKPPSWWTSYNHIKHKRAKYYNEANLENTLNTMGALLTVLALYYSKKLQPHNNESIEISRLIFDDLKPNPRLLSLDYQYHLSMKNVLRSRKF